MRLLIFMLFPVFTYAQQDSTFYEKRDTQWYKINVRIEGLKKTTTEEPYTTIDSLIKRTLINELHDASKQYREFRLRSEESEKDYLLRLRNADRQYRTLYNKRPDLDSLSNAKQLIGTWLLDGLEISITKQLKLLSASINFVSEDVFWVTNNGREYFFKRNKNWISDKRKLEPKVTRTIK